MQAWTASWSSSASQKARAPLSPYAAPAARSRSTPAVQHPLLPQRPMTQLPAARRAADQASSRNGVQKPPAAPLLRGRCPLTGDMCSSCTAWACATRQPTWMPSSPASARAPSSPLSGMSLAATSRPCYAACAAMPEAQRAQCACRKNDLCMGQGRHRYSMQPAMQSSQQESSVMVACKVTSGGLAVGVGGSMMRQRWRCLPTQRRRSWRSRRQALAHVTS